MLAPHAYILRRNPWPRQRVQLRWKAEVVARPAYNLRNFERYIEFLRCQDNVLVKSNVTDNLQACGSVVLVVRAAAEHEKSQVKYSISFVKKSSKCYLYCTSDDAMTNVIIHNIPYYPGTTGNNSVISTPPRVTKSILQVKISLWNKQSGVRSHCRQNRLSPTPTE